MDPMASPAPQVGHGKGRASASAVLQCDVPEVFTQSGKFLLRGTSPETH
eukprot:CAMPEP_0203945466 /NCGR_PEP_ID=MMETSP0359-20131031/80976_1 /ASSEMBLY_ACC=CAM_ASM_000338 /TAXON_ID=268821 /ORGANISM="Scrippsiella Hangoei, Strain SHTV-5" /LENGTH=48 /DNA_ID= /DNA_START= /DNA_END= /DNA_ORIENTATION=